MRTLYLVLLVCVVVCGVGVRGYSHTPVQYHIQTDDGPDRYFRFQTYNGQYRKEKRLDDGTVVGAYGWVDATGILRLYDYIADDQGYRVVRQRTLRVAKPTPPPVTTTPAPHRLRPTPEALGSPQGLHSPQGLRVSSLTANRKSPRPLHLVPVAVPIHSAAAPIHSPAAQVHTAAAPVHTAAAPVHTAAAPVHTAAAPVHTAAVSLNKVAVPLHKTDTPEHRANSVPTAGSPVHTTTAHVHTAAGKVHTAAGQVRTAAALVHTANAPVLTGAAPVITAAAPVLTAAAPVLTAAAQVLTANAPVHTAAAQSHTVRAPVLTAAAPVLKAVTPIPNSEALRRRPNRPNTRTRIRGSTRWGSRRPTQTSRPQRVRPLSQSAQAKSGTSVSGGVDSAVQRKKEEVMAASYDGDLPAGGKTTINYDLGNQFHFEKMYPDGTKVGKHGYVDPLGILRVSHYTSGPQGHTQRQQSGWVGTRDPAPQ